MEQESDWLLQLVLREVEDVWMPVATGDSPDNPPPNVLHVVQCANADWDGVICQPPVIRAWQYDRSGQRTEVLPDDSVAKAEFFTQMRDRDSDSRFYPTGRFMFHVAADRGLVMLNHTLGPRYAGGWISGIVGAGEGAKLEKDSAFGVWAA